MSARRVYYVRANSAVERVAAALTRTPLGELCFFVVTPNFSWASRRISQCHSPVATAERSLWAGSRNGTGHTRLEAFDRLRGWE
jgi:hypothetical protein